MVGVCEFVELIRLEKLCHFCARSRVLGQISAGCMPFTSDFIGCVVSVSMLLAYSLTCWNKQAGERIVDLCSGLDLVYTSQVLLGLRVDF